MSTITYLFPGSGTVAPSASVAFPAAMQTATVQFSDADTTATVVNNWGLSTSELARGYPIAIVQQLAGGTAAPLIAIALNSNNVVLSKQSTATGSGGTVQLTVFKHSILMPTAP